MNDKKDILTFEIKFDDNGEIILNDVSHVSPVIELESLSININKQWLSKKPQLTKEEAPYIHDLDNLNDYRSRSLTNLEFMLALSEGKKLTKINDNNHGLYIYFDSEINMIFDQFGRCASISSFEGWELVDESKELTDLQKQNIELFRFKNSNLDEIDNDLEDSTSDDDDDNTEIINYSENFMPL